ncbi:MAG: HAD hydrolase family protein, partial [Clostridia bacterium]|nr:HAD hydrolase family protein [Clostridia bacterium]
SGNGAVIYYLPNNEIIYNKFIENKKAIQIIDICEQNSIYYSVYTEDSIIAKNLNYNVLVFNRENINKPEDKQTKIKIVENIKKYFEDNKDEKIIKVNICDDSKIIFGRITEKLERVKNINVLEVEHMSRKLIRSGNQEIPIEYYYTEISSKNVDKWEAIKFLMEKLDIKQEEVMTIGDNMNDKNMILNAGLGIAMGKSALAAQKIGKHIVSDNNLNGVAEAIEKFAL